jgi:hypothetical protein
VGPPGGGLRGKAFIAALLDRDESLADQANAEQTAIELAGELASQYQESKATSHDTVN